MAYPKCERADGCNGRHDWHGTPCSKDACHCPATDDYWNERPA